MFGRKKQPHPSSVVIAAANNVVRQTATLEELKTQELQSHPHSYYLDTFDKLRKELYAAFAPKDVKQLSSSDRNDFEKLVGYFDLIRKIWLSIDRTRITPAIGKTLYNTLHVDLTGIVNAFHYEVVNGEDVGWAAEMVEMEVSQLCRQMNDLVRDAANSRVTIQPSNPEIPAPAANIVAGFPIFEAEDDEELQDSYNRIQELWVRLKERNNIIDDEFFLEQAAKQYVPDVLAIYNSFNHAGVKEKKAARDLLLEHFQTIELKMLEIATHNMRTNLKELRTQVVFMKDKIVPSPDSDLVLEKSTDE